jgi:hypothetical protein
MQTIKPWLEQLGLSQYAQVFADNDVDLEALCLLTDAEPAESRRFPGAP